MVFLPLINNITLLLSLSILYSLISRRWDYTSLWHRVIAGILFGLVAVIGMMNPLKLQPGVIFDGRSIILSIGGLFGGPITALISALISSTYRIYLGGAGVIMGVGVILSSSLIGIVYYYVRKQYPKSTHFGYLLIFGVTVHVCMLFLTSTLPSGISLSILKTIALPVLLIYPAGSLVMCLLLLQQQSRLNVEKSLKKSEENYRILVERASSSIIKLDRYGRIQFVNSFAQSTFGYKQEELIGKFAVGSLVNKNKKNIREFAGIIDELFQNPERHRSLEIEVLCKNGEIKWISWTNKVIHADNDDLLELLCIGNDITQKKNAELALVESEKKFRLLHESLMDGYLVVDLGGRIIDCNAAFLEMTGYSKDELLKFTNKDLTPIQWHEFENSLLDENFFRIGYTELYEKECRRKDGENISIELRTYLLTDDNSGAIGMWAIIRDISNRKKVEKELQKSEEKYRSIIELAADTILMGDINGDLIGANLKATELTGFSTEELIGRNISTLFAQNELTQKPLRYDLLLEGNVVMMERTIRRKDGSEVVVEMNSKRMPHNTYISMIRDVTERINNEKYLRESEHKLRIQNAEYLALNEELKESNQRIRDINEKLIKVTEKAQESDNLKTAFLSNMSHEIRTPMNGIVGFCGLLQRSDITKAEQEKYVEIIINSSYQLLSIINNIIDYSRIEAGQISVNKSKISMDKMLNDVLNKYAEIARTKNINLVTTLPRSSNTNHIYSDENKVKQVLENLLNNAIKFTEKGNVEVGYVHKDGFVEIYVKDQGIGIDQENHSMIFERFRQVEGANLSSTTGTGLGLAISRSLVEIMDGKIWVESSKGKGAKFCFTLPRV